MKIAVIGAGAFGSALAHVWASHMPANVMLYARSQPKIASFGEDFEFDMGLEHTQDLAQAMAFAQILVIAVPTQKIGMLMAQMSREIRRDHLLVSCAKGYSIAHHCTPAQEMAQWAENHRIYALSGPGFAVDLAQGKPTAMALAGDVRYLEQLQSCLSTKSLRLYRSIHRDSVELGGALKNVLALGAGAIIGSGLGESARAAFLTRGMVELMRIASALGAAQEPLMGLCGFGDLILTSHSNLSRNYRQGVALGQGADLDQAMTTEGLATVKAFSHLARERGLDLPLFYAIEELCNGAVTVQELTQSLMKRDLIGE